MANGITMHRKKTRDLVIKTVFSFLCETRQSKQFDQKAAALNVEALLRTVDCVQEQQRRDLLKLLSLEVGGQAPTML